jgi:hypothetical protein
MIMLHTQTPIKFSKPLSPNKPSKSFTIFSSSFFGGFGPKVYNINITRQANNETNAKPA